jgi:hypothetical protein
LNISQKNTNNEIVNDKFVFSDGTSQDAGDIILHKGIYFNNSGFILGKDGWLKIYDEETDMVIAELSSNSLDNYKKDKPYIYEYPVRNIRIETSPIEYGGELGITNIKEIDDELLTETYTKE